MKSYIAYYRVSTAKQSLGLDAQRETVTRYLNGAKPICEFEEKESGKNDDRPELAKAIAACKRQGATLLVAKLDRLSRDLHFITGLQKSGVHFCCADTPELDEFTVHIFAAMAQRERKLISQRTREGLAVLKACGVKLGNPRNGSKEQIAAANAGAKRKADQHAALAMVEIERWRARGITTLPALAEMLSGKVATARGGDRWHPTQVARVLARTTSNHQNS